MSADPSASAVRGQEAGNVRGLEGRHRRTRQCQNVVVKLGGLGMLFGMFDFHTRETPPSSEDLARAYKPYIETCIESFGPIAACSRATSRRTASVELRRPVECLHTPGRRLRADEKPSCSGGTAKRVYRLA